jgi:hypothetical protein
MHRALYRKSTFGDKKMTEKTILTTLEEYTKYFDLCYWKERRLNPESPDLKNWTARKRENFRKNWFGRKNEC